MPRINLLPWREELRQKRKKEFVLALVGAVMLGGLVAYVSKLTVRSWTAQQEARNTVLKTEIAALDKQIDEILGLEDQKERLLARMQIIERLQRSRPEAVHLMDELVDTLPEGVHLTDVEQQGTRIEVKGEAQSSTRVSALMRNIDASQWLKDPGLDVVQSVDSGPEELAQFTVFAQQVTVDDEDGDDGEVPQ
jgi:type IV pilus assembly protein PilN